MALHSVPHPAHHPPPHTMASTASLANSMRLAFILMHAKHRSATLLIIKSLGGPVCPIHTIPPPTEPLSRFHGPRLPSLGDTTRQRLLFRCSFDFSISRSSANLQIPCIRPCASLDISLIFGRTSRVGLRGGERARIEYLVFSSHRSFHVRRIVCYQFDQSQVSDG